MPDPISTILNQAVISAGPYAGSACSPPWRGEVFGKIALQFLTENSLQDATVTRNEAGDCEATTLAGGWSMTNCPAADYVDFSIPIDGNWFVATRQNRFFYDLQLIKGNKVIAEIRPDCNALKSFFRVFGVDAQAIRSIAGAFMLITEGVYQVEAKTGMPLWSYENAATLADSEFNPKYMSLSSQ